MPGNVNYITRGSREYRRANLALFIAGYVTFSTLYDFQPLLPLLAGEFGISPAMGSLPLSVATFALAWTLPISGTISDALGRRVLMGAAVLLTSLMALCTLGIESVVPLIALRLAQGMVLAGVPAVAMAYLSEEMEPGALGAAMGLYIAGNAMGGMTGRILTAWLADYLPWRGAIGVIGVLSLVLSLVFLALLPPSRNFQRRPFRPGPLTRSLLGLLRHRGLLYLFALAFTCMGGFVTLYNYATFRLLAPPYSLSQSQVALIFISYAFGAFGSSFMGSLVNRFGRDKILLASLGIMNAGLLLTVLPPLAAVIAGIVVFTIGFFGAHSVASAWVGTLAPGARAQASSLYLFFYYLGSSISGTGGGFFWSAWGWSGVAGLILLLTGAATLVAMRLAALHAAPAGPQGAEIPPGSPAASAFPGAAATKNPGTSPILAPGSVTRLGR
ncbi:MFS transporter [Desulfuromonas versatilis]|uniref:MFS transporter n=1 Tax=Desulfuromonas versatilis TaxID=2802975 RepID=A0ABM8HVA2_9BACT|nr:MFS transporter [Desulfuromonas versatilis]BCR04614.1 MFS transporter [Desulfuromonas versatilis]